MLVLVSLSAITVNVTGQTRAPRVPATVSGAIETNARDGLKYVLVPAATFQMGCSIGDQACLDDEKPAHAVTISKGYRLGQTEVTVGAYKAFTQATSRPMPPEPLFLDRPLNVGWRDETMPIVNVSWEEAQAFCEWIGGRLPTEAEWELAARAGTKTAQYDDLPRMAWYASNSGTAILDAEHLWEQDRDNYVRRLFANDNRFHAVGQMRPNAFGLYDMLGNVWEWTHDSYDANYYRESPSVDPRGPSSGDQHAIRGGSWSFHPTELRVSARGHNRPDNRGANRGFRCTRDMG